MCFSCPEYHTTLARGLGCFWRWPWPRPMIHFPRSTVKCVFFMPQILHNTYRASEMHFRGENDLDLVTYFSKSTEKLIFGAQNTTQHLLEVWGVFFRMWPWPWPLTYILRSTEKMRFSCPEYHTTLARGLGCFWRWPWPRHMTYFPRSTVKCVFSCPKYYTTLIGGLGCIYRGDLDLHHVTYFSKSTEKHAPNTTQHISGVWDAF
jgi:hypothetical protein